MLSRELIQLAVLASQHGPELCAEQNALSAAGMRQYWAASKCRLDRWTRRLRRSNDARPRPATLIATVEEILSGEVLTRVWTAVCCAHDRRHAQLNHEPLAQSVLLAHLEARRRALRVLLFRSPIDARQQARLNRLRRLCERWTDCLVGHLLSSCDVSQFAFDTKRARDFRQDLDPCGGQLQPMRWKLLMASFCASFDRLLVSPSENLDLNALIAAGILACFPARMLDDTVLTRAAWIVRLFTAVDDAQAMLGEAVDLERARQPAA
jgi:hypothetical protein